MSTKTKNLKNSAKKAAKKVGLALANAGNAVADVLEGLTTLPKGTAKSIDSAVKRITLQQDFSKEAFQQAVRALNKLYKAAEKENEEAIKANQSPVISQNIMNTLQKTIEGYTEYAKKALSRKEMQQVEKKFSTIYKKIDKKLSKPQKTPHPFVQPDGSVKTAAKALFNIPKNTVALLLEIIAGADAVFLDNALINKIEDKLADAGDADKEKRGEIAKWFNEHPRAMATLSYLVSLGMVFFLLYEFAVKNFLDDLNKTDEKPTKKIEKFIDDAKEKLFGNGDKEDEEEEQEDEPIQDEFIATTEQNDTLWALSIRYNTTVEKLEKLNNINQMDTLYPNTKIRTGLPKDRVEEFVITVQPEENPTVIANRYNISAKKLLHMNNRSMKSVIKAGDTLKITIIKDENSRNEPVNTKQIQNETQINEPAKVKQIQKEIQIEETNDLMIMALEAYKNEDYEEAIGLYTKAIEEDKNNIDAYSDLSLVYKKFGDKYKHKDHRTALENYDEACKIARQGLKIIDKIHPEKSDKKATLYFNAGIARLAMARIYIIRDDTDNAKKESQNAVTNFGLAYKHNASKTYMDFVDIAQEMLNRLNLDGYKVPAKKTREKTVRPTEIPKDKKGYELDLNYLNWLDSQLDKTIDLNQSDADITEQIWPLLYPLLKRNETRRIPYARNAGENVLTQVEGLTFKKVTDPNNPDKFGFFRLRVVAAKDKKGRIIERALTAHELETAKGAMENSSNDERTQELKNFVQTQIVPSLKSKSKVRKRKMREVLALADEEWNLPGSMTKTIELLDAGEKPEIAFYQISSGWNAGITKRRYAELLMYTGNESITTIMFQKAGSYGAGISSPTGAKEDWFVKHGWIKSAKNINGKPTYEFILGGKAITFENNITNTKGYKAKPKVKDSLIGAWRKGYTSFPFYGLEKDVKKADQSLVTKDIKKKYEEELYRLFKNKVSYHTPSNYKVEFVPVKGKIKSDTWKITDFETLDEGVRVIVDKITDEDEDETTQQKQKNVTPAKSKKEQKQKKVTPAKSKKEQQQKNVTPTKGKKEPQQQPKKKKGSRAQKFQFGKKIIEVRYAKQSSDAKRNQIVNEDKSYS